MALQLNKKQYAFVFDYLIPALDVIANNHQDNEDLADKCRNAIYSLSDINLTALSGNMIDFERYLSSSLNIYQYCRVEFCEVGACIEDNLYFLLLRQFLKDESIIKEKYDLSYNNLVWPIVQVGNFHRKLSAVEKIHELAKKSSAASLSEALEQAKTQIMAPQPINKSCSRDSFFNKMDEPTDFQLSISSTYQVKSRLG